MSSSDPFGSGDPFGSPSESGPTNDSYTAPWSHPQFGADPMAPWNAPGASEFNKAWNDPLGLGPGREEAERYIAEKTGDGGTGDLW